MPNISWRWTKWIYYG